MPFTEPDVRALFPVPLLTIKLDDAETLNAQLLAEIAKRRRLETGVARSNRYGWHSVADLFERKEPGHAALAREIEAMVKAATGKMMPDMDYAALQPRFEGWANASPRGAMNAPHDHPSAFWSGCYYVEVPPPADPEDRLAGAIEFLDSRGNLGAGALLESPFTRGKFTLRPAAGTALIWPGFLKHWVYPNGSDEERVTVAFNAWFTRSRRAG